MRNCILLAMIFFLGCAGPTTIPVPPQELSEYTAPNWSTDGSITAINSKVSPKNRQILLTTMRTILDRELFLFTERVSTLPGMIQFQEEHLQRVIAAYPETGIPTSEDEENFVCYYASMRVQLEILKIHYLHEEAFNRIERALVKLAISLPEER